jgi:hypothetical protein
MEIFGMASLFGLILGFMFGVGCAMAVLYTVYLGGYRKGIEDSLQRDKSVPYLENVGKIQAKLGERASGRMSDLR